MKKIKNILPVWATKYQDVKRKGADSYLVNDLICAAQEQIVMPSLTKFFMMKKELGTEKAIRDIVIDYAIDMMKSVGVEDVKIKFTKTNK